MSKTKKVEKLPSKTEEVEESESEEKTNESEIEVEKFRETLGRTSSISVSPVLKSGETLEEISEPTQVTFNNEQGEEETKIYEGKSKRFYEASSTKKQEGREYKAPEPIGVPTKEKSEGRRTEMMEQENLRRTLSNDRKTLGQGRKEFENIEGRKYFTEEEKKRRRYMM
tara:strand:+ start:190 stop:696 length:507 start_codon:yes stop_codon:yes gene_type:complete